MAEKNGLSKTAVLSGDRSKKNHAGSVKSLSKDPVSFVAQNSGGMTHPTPGGTVSDMTKRGSTK
jgi:hypothetical protein